MTRKSILIGLAAFVLLAVAFTFGFYRLAVDIETVISVKQAEAAFDSTALGKPQVYLSVISRYPPNIIYRGYQPILDYLTAHTPYRFELKLCDEYSSAVSMLVHKEVVAAFLGSYVYVKAHEEHGVIPILKPLNENFEPFSRSVVITSSASDIYSIRDLRQRTIALPSRESLSSNWLVTYEFPRHNIRPGDPAAIVNFPHHQSVLQNVARRLYDAGVTREYLVRQVTDGSLRAILYSDPFPTSPIVVASDYPREVIDTMKAVLLRINRSTPDRETITRDWDNEFIYGFVEAEDRDYDAVRAISSR